MMINLTTKKMARDDKRSCFCQADDDDDDADAESFCWRQSVLAGLFFNLCNDDDYYEND